MRRPTPQRAKGRASGGTLLGPRWAYAAQPLRRQQPRPDHPVIRVDPGTQPLPTARSPHPLRDDPRLPTHTTLNLDMTPRRPARRRRGLLDRLTRGPLRQRPPLTRLRPIPHPPNVSRPSDSHPGRLGHTTDGLPRHQPHYWPGAALPYQPGPSVPHGSKQRHPRRSRLITTAQCHDRNTGPYSQWSWADEAMGDVRTGRVTATPSASTKVPANASTVGLSGSSQMRV